MIWCLRALAALVGDPRSQDCNYSFQRSYVLCGQGALVVYLHTFRQSTNKLQIKIECEKNKRSLFWNICTLAVVNALAVCLMFLRLISDFFFLLTKAFKFPIRLSSLNGSNS